MRVFPLLRRAAALLCAVLLPLAAPQEGVHAQTTGGAAVRTVINIAEASWETHGNRQETASNRVAFDVATQPPAPPSIRVFRRAPGGNGPELVYRAPQCSVGGVAAATLRANAIASLTPGGNAVSTAPTSVVNVQQTDELRGGEPLFFEITAISANLDPTAIDSLTVVLTTPEGDQETMTVYETTADSGLFAGVIDTQRIPPPLVREDCRLSVGADSRITIAAMRPGNDTILVSAEVTVLVDPFGVVFDSETGAPVDGARVTLVNADTGAPATVFAEDGVTP
ncbi:hypothetical protein [Erythrobacter sp. CCH5-A1]|uniref:hypothetical protein n=1 Tax=Erythrobacter sp. CCH5-A1 TaxID=1768792 RepID=UPI000A3E79C5|nr:hypothetical protein [Erythrobacter sp. CCH5-A1]